MNWYKQAKRNPFDLYSNTIVRYVFNEVKSGEKSNFINVDRDLKEQIPGLKNIFYRVESNKDLEEIKVNGGYIPRAGLLQINILIPNIELNPENYEELYFELNNVVRHELEHAWQKANQNSINVFSPKQQDPVEQIKEYLLKPYEIDAFVKGFYHTAKKQNKSPEDLMKKWLGEKLKYHSAFEGVDPKRLFEAFREVYSVWLDSLNRQFPQRAKIASPMAFEDESSYTGYMDIGHTGNNNILWLIDKNLRLRTISVANLLEQTGSSEHNTHLYWGEYINNPDVIATGRYDKQKNIASMAIEKTKIMRGAPSFAIAEKRLENAINKISKILDRTFGNPEIRVYK